jgi:hypothetical protein
MKDEYSWEDIRLSGSTTHDVGAPPIALPQHGNGSTAFFTDVNPRSPEHVLTSLPPPFLGFRKGIPHLRDVLTLVFNK